MIDKLKDSYKEKREAIQYRLKDFQNLEEKKHFQEFLYCLLTPQSNAKKCWSAVLELLKLKSLNNQEEIINILKTRTRFHNNKSKYVMRAEETFREIKPLLKNPNIPELRNQIKEKVTGYGLKEASHFLRNIGKSNNQIAILDRHILRNLREFNIIKDDKLTNKNYLEMEQKFIEFSKKVGIPIDELDLLFWSQENGAVFK